MCLEYKINSSGIRRLTDLLANEARIILDKIDPTFPNPNSFENFLSNLLQISLDERVRMSFSRFSRRCMLRKLGKLECIVEDIAQALETHVGAVK